MKSENFIVKVSISEQEVNEIVIKRAIEMVIMHAFNYGAKYVSDFVEELTYESTDDFTYERTDELLETIVARFADDCSEYALTHIEDDSDLTTHIQALKNAIKNAVSNQKSEKLFVANLIDQNFV